MDQIIGILINYNYNYNTEIDIHVTWNAGKFTDEKLKIFTDAITAKLIKL